MNDCLDAKDEDHVLSLDDEAESKIDTMLEERYVAPNRSRYHTRVGLSPPRQHATDNDPKSAEFLSKNTTVRRGLPANDTERFRKNQIPLLDKMPVRCLTGSFSLANAVLLIIKAQTDPSASVREALRAVYAIFKSNAPDLTFHPSSKDLRCRGYFTRDFDTCTFVAQIWRVHPSFAVSDQPGEHIFEIRRTSYGGRDAFEMLLSAVAVGLRNAGHAKYYASGFEIFPKLSIEEYSMPRLSSTEKYPISLDTDSVSRLTSLVVNRRRPIYSDTLRLLAQCSAGSKGNCEMLMESDKLGEAVLRELSDGSEAGACLNAMKLIELGATVPKEAFTGVARSMLVYCSKKPTGYKGMRSQAIENAALRAMDVLMRKMQKEEREEAFRKIEKVLSGKLREKLFCELQSICLRKS